MLQSLFSGRSKKYEATAPFTDLGSLPFEDENESHDICPVGNRIKPINTRTLQPVSSNIINNKSDSSGDKLKQAYDIKMKKAIIANVISPDKRDFLKIKSPILERSKTNKVHNYSEDSKLAKTPIGKDAVWIDSKTPSEPFYYQYERHKFSKSANSSSSKSRTPVPVEPQLYVYDDEEVQGSEQPEYYSENIAPEQNNENQWYDQAWPEQAHESPYQDRSWIGYENEAKNVEHNSQYNKDPYYQETKGSNENYVQYDQMVNEHIDMVFSKVRHNHIADVKQAIAEGFHPHSVDYNGNTMLHICAQNNLRKMAQVVIAAGCPINEVNLKGLTALDYANQYQFRELINLLLERYQALEVADSKHSSLLYR